MINCRLYTFSNTIVTYHRCPAFFMDENLKSFKKKPRFPSCNPTLHRNNRIKTIRSKTRNVYCCCCFSDSFCILVELNERSCNLNFHEHDVSDFRFHIYILYNIIRAFANHFREKSNPLFST